MRYPADPPTVEEIVCVLRQAGGDPDGWRLRAMIVMLWRGGLRVHEALALSERDLDPQRGSVLVRHGKGGRRREVGLDQRARLIATTTRKSRAHSRRRAVEAATVVHAGPPIHAI
jgi:site-specific recombinase XerD